MVGFKFVVDWVPFVLSSLLQNPITELLSHRLEITIFIVPWAWGVVIAATLTFLCAHVLRSLLRPNRPDPPAPKKTKGTKTSRMPMIFGRRQLPPEERDATEVVVGVLTPDPSAPPWMDVDPRAQQPRAVHYSRNKSWSANVTDM